MLQMLVKAVFNIVVWLIQLFAQPCIDAILLLFPDLTPFVLHIAAFFSQAFTYLQTILHWFLFENTMFVAIFSYFAIKFSIWLTVCTVRNVLKLYNTFKP